MSTTSRIPLPPLASTQVGIKPRRHRTYRPPPNQGSPQNKPSRADFETPANTPSAPQGSPADTAIQRQTEILQKLSVQELDSRVKKRLDYQESDTQYIQRQKRELAAQRKQIEAVKRQTEERLRFSERLAATHDVADRIVRGAASIAHRQTRHVDRAGRSLVFAAPANTPPVTSHPRSQFQLTPVPVSRPRADSDEPDNEDAPDEPRVQPPPPQPQASTSDVGSQTQVATASADTQTSLTNFSPSTSQSTQTQVRATMLRRRKIDKKPSGPKI